MSSAPRTPERTPGDSAPANPFHGLRRFDIEDADLFFGRERETYEVLRRLRMMHFVAVLGPSGCGKSSLIRAGALATLGAGYMAEEAPWRIVSLQPGNGPLDAWRAALRPLLRQGADEEELLIDPAKALESSIGKIVILVDQFEELFQYSERTGRDRDVRLFLQAMLSASAAADSRVHVVITMRTEYLAQCAAYPNLAEAINEGLYLVPEMTRDQMREAIVLPIRKVGAEITVALVDRLLNDASGQTDPLPVLQHALMRMWTKKRPWEPLGLPEYEAQIRALAPAASVRDGSVHSTDAQLQEGMGAFISGHAHEVLTKLGADDQAAAKRIFQTLTELTDAGRAVRRATASSDIQSLTGLSQDRLDRVVAAFHAEGFLNVWQSPNAESVLVDLTHEAVARQWRELREWMVEESRVRRNIRRVAEAASDWAKHERNRAYLFRGLQLTESQTYLRGRDHLLDAMSKAFLKASSRNEVWNRLLSPEVLVGILFLVMVLGGLTYISVTKATLATKQTELARLFVTRAQEEAELTKKAQQEAVFNEQSATALAARLVQPTSADTIQPRVYIQIRSQEQRAQAQGLADPLKAAGFVVPAIQNVAVGPYSTEVRYFRKTDETGAKRILDVLTGSKVTAKPVLVQGYETSTRIRDAHFELWLAPSPTVVGPSLSSRGLTPAQTGALIGPANAGCKPVTATFSPATGDPLQKIDLQLEYTQCDDFRSSVRFKTFSRETADGAFGDPDGEAAVGETKRSPDNEYDLKLIATARSGLDSTQTRQALVAATTVRANKTYAATQEQAINDVRAIIMARSAPEK